MTPQTSVLILGGTGIIGRELAAVSTMTGFDVTVISRSGGDLNTTVRTIAADVRDRYALAAAVRDRHYAAVIDLVSFDSAQLETTLRVLSPQCEQYILVSSATVYAGVSAPGLISEVSAPTTGPWLYPLRKLEAEAALRERCSASGQRYTIVRPYITYSSQRVSFGPWEVDDVLPRLTRGLPIPLGSSLADSRTSLTHAHDLARGIAGLVGNPAALDQDFNIASDETVTWRELFHIAANAVGTELDLRIVPDRDAELVFPALRGKLADRKAGRAFDIRKLQAAIPGFQFEISTAHGYANALREHGQRDARMYNPAVQGGLDRLTSMSHPDARLMLRRHRAQISRSGPRALLRYLGERYRALSLVKGAVRRAAGRANREIDPYQLTSPS
jgi:nucleoside-diphosphate-sugar epimerase